MSEENQAGAFTAPPAVASGNADVNKNVGQVSKKSATAKVAKPTARNIKVVAIDKGWFDCKRIVPGQKFAVSAEEFSEKWMEKI